MQESLSKAYVSAIAGRAGHNISFDRVHDYGVDGSFKHVEKVESRRRETGFAIDFQLKASTNWEVESPEIVYDLEAKNYNDLVVRSNRLRAQPFILILLCLHPTEADWIEVTHESLILRKCAYWAYLRGNTTTNDCTKRIKIPTTNKLTPDCLTNLLKKVENGDCL